MARSIDSRVKALDKALRTRAQAMRLCAIHATRLWCSHEWEWSGTKAQRSECFDLMDRLHPYLQQLHPTEQRCQTCGEDLWCDACCYEQLAAIESHELDTTPEEDARCQELMALMRPTQPGQRTTTYPWQAQEPPPALRSDPARNLAPDEIGEDIEAEPRETPAIHNAPAPVVDDEDEDAEIDDALVADLLAQVQRRLAR